MGMGASAVVGKRALRKRLSAKKNIPTNRGYKPLASIPLRHWSRYSHPHNTALRQFKKRIDVVSMPNDVEEEIAIAL